MLKDDIRTLRHAAGLTQQQLAVQLGIGLMAVSAWECGVHVPSAAMCERIAEALGAVYQAPRILPRVKVNTGISSCNLKVIKDN